MWRRRHINIEWTAPENDERDLNTGSSYVNECVSRLSLILFIVDSM